MPKQLLTGTLEEQCEFLYNLAQEKMAQGNFTGAAHALAEVVKHAPDFRDAQALLAEAKARKAAQQRLLIAGILGALLFVGLGSLLQLSNDLVLIGLALAGAVAGYGVGNWLESYRLQAGAVEK
ncbi:MAG: hypothetical protein DCC55_01165 [Chloroflexi bacterium]|nr:MAG: hypothetical protein DCC55_01165 [Chloroflexota bacterium]